MDEWLGWSPNVLAYLNWGVSFFGIKLTFLVMIYLVLLAGYIFYYEDIEKQRWKKIDQTLKTLDDFHNHLRNLELKSLNLQEDINRFFRDRESENEQDFAISLLKHAYDEFYEGVRSYQERLCNVYQAEDFFKASTLFQTQLSSVSHQAGFATATGLLFTFMALTCGLSELVYNEQTKLIEEGLGGFINALSAKFITSLIGLGVAIRVNHKFQEKEHQLTEALNGIVYELNRRFKRLTAQEVLVEIKQDVHQLPQQIGSYLTQSEGNDSFIKRLEALLSEQLKVAVDGIQTSVRDVRGDVQQVSQAMSGFSAQGFESLTKQFEQIGKELREGISSGVSQDLQRLSSIMEQLPNIVHITLEEINNSMAGMKATLQETQRQTAEAIKELLREIQDAQGSNVEQLLNAFMTKTQELNQRFIEQQEASHQKHEEGMAVLQALLNNMKASQQEAGQQVNEAIQKQLETLTNQFSHLLEQLQNTQKEQQNTISSETQAMLNQITEMVTTTQSTINTGVGNSTENLNNVQVAFMSQVQQSIEDFKALSTDALDRQERQLIPVLQGLESTTQSLKSTVAELPKGLQQAQEQLTFAMTQLQHLISNELQRFIEQQGSLTTEQRQALIELRSVIEDVTRLQQQAQGMQVLLNDLVEMQKKIESSRDNLNTITQDRLEQFTYGLEQQKQWLAQQNDLMGQLQERYAQLNHLSSEISQTLGNAGQAMAEGIKYVQDASKGYFDTFTEQHTRGLDQLRSFMNELQDVFISSKLSTPQ